jgi:hypothetical protein
MAGSRQVWDFTGLRAMFLNGTLKGSAEVPSTEGLIEVSASLMRRHGVEVEVLQAIAHDTDNAADPGCGDRFGDHSERDMPTACPLACDAIRLPICKSQWLRLNCTQPIFAHQHTGPCPVVAADPSSPRPDDPQALILAGFTPPRAPMGPGEEVPPPLVKVTQPLLLNGLRPAGKPRLRSPGRRQLRGLGVEARCGAPSSAATSGAAPGRGSTRIGRGRTARPGAPSARRSDTDGTS